jgi:hypothetical protein
MVGGLMARKQHPRLPSLHGVGVIRERPILFSAPMVRAILEGRKTQTRRVVKPRRDPDFGCELSPGEIAGEIRDGHYEICPYGQPGARLWVREAFSGPHCMDAVPPSKWGRSSRIWYWADGNPQDGDWTKPKPSIHMPRWASRITLEITGVRVERLHQISEEDALAEGVHRFDWQDDNGECPATTREAFARLWESINGAGGWAVNPFVWVVSFRRVECA